MLPKVAIILDDIIDDVDPWIGLAGFLKEKGAVKVYAMATHGVLSGDSFRLIQNTNSLDKVIVTNTGLYFVKAVLICDYNVRMYKIPASISPNPFLNMTRINNFIQFSSPSPSFK